jgi:hypothetical protein
MVLFLISFGCWLDVLDWATLIVAAGFGTFFGNAKGIGAAAHLGPDIIRIDARAMPQRDEVVQQIGALPDDEKVTLYKAWCLVEMTVARQSDVLEICFGAFDHFEAVHCDEHVLFSFTLWIDTVVDSGGSFGLFAVLAQPVEVTDVNRGHLKR